MAFLGLAVVYMMRINLSVAIVSMVGMDPPLSSDVNTSTRPIPTSDFCPIKNSIGPTPASFVITKISSFFCIDQVYKLNKSEIKLQNGEFDWDSKTQGIILGSFFWGYMVTQIPGAFLARKFGGGKYIFGLGIALTGIFSLLTPWAARYSTDALIACRILMGLSEVCTWQQQKTYPNIISFVRSLQGVTLPAITHMLSYWVPVEERSTIGAFVLAGITIDVVIYLLQFHHFSRFT